jgi:chaperone LolA
MRLIGALLSLLVVVEVHGWQTPPPADQLARQVQAHYDKVKDFTADFTQTFKGLVLPQQTNERGKVWVKKPYRMRWTYTAPEKKELVADGLQFWDYRPADKVVLVKSLPKENEASTALLFLAGRGNLTRDFTASLAPTHPDGEWHLKLVPKSPQADFTSLLIQMDRTSLAMRGLVKTDDSGVWTYKFQNLKENVGLADSAFTFAPPKGVEIIR